MLEGCSKIIYILLNEFWQFVFFKEAICVIYVVRFVCAELLVSPFTFLLSAGSVVIVHVPFLHILVFCVSQSSYKFVSFFQWAFCYYFLYFLFCFVLNSLISAIFIFLSSACFGFIFVFLCLCFWAGSLDYYFETFFLMSVFSTIKFLFHIALVMSYKFWYIAFLFLFSAMYFLIYFQTFFLTHWLLRNVLFGFQVLEIFSLSFCYWFPVWLHCGWRKHSKTSVLLSFFRFVLWPRIWSIFVYLSWGLEKNVHLATVDGVL